MTILLASALLSGCGQQGESIAKVNGDPISKEQYEAFLKFKRIPAAQDQRKADILDQYLEREALAAVIEKEGKLDNAITAAELNEFRKEMLISRYFEQYLGDTVTDQAVQNYYASHAEQYNENKIHVAHILLRTNSTMNDAERMAKRTAVQEAYSKIQAGEAFEKVAEAYSDDTLSAKKGGDLGWIKDGAIAPEFSKSAFALKTGEVSEPFETSFGYHIVKSIEGPTVVSRPFEAVSGNIRYQLRNEAKDAELKRLLGKVEIEKVGE
ncbi:MAG TPA: peptidylprolyl isomerase [Gammaproteobacteria bacterium]